MSDEKAKVKKVDVQATGATGGPSGYSRDEFAAQALNALVLAHYARGLVPPDEDLASDAYHLADAMMLARGN